jgi:hypothetical protein
MARWIACSPNGAGYFSADKTLKASAMADPANPVVTNTAGRKLAYRLSGDKGDLFGLDRGTGVAQWYMGPRKWLDPFRGKSSDPNGAGSIDIPLFRLAETYLIRAEAKAHLNDVLGAAQDLNAIRNQAGLTNTMATTTNEIIDAILQERRLEFFTEFGQRFFDLKRTNFLLPANRGSGRRLVVHHLLGAARQNFPQIFFPSAEGSVCVFLCSKGQG